MVRWENMQKRIENETTMKQKVRSNVAMGSLNFILSKIVSSGVS